MSAEPSVAPQQKSHMEVITSVEAYFKLYWRLASIGINPPVYCSGPMVNSLHDAGVFAE